VGTGFSDSASVFAKGRSRFQWGGLGALVVANLQSSFKLGFMSTASGTLTTDQTVGVSGQIGSKRR